MRNSVTTNNNARAGGSSKVLDLVGLAILFVGVMLMTLQCGPSTSSQEGFPGDISVDFDDSSLIPLGESSEKSGCAVTVKGLTLHEEGLHSVNEFVDPILGRIAIVEMTLTNISEELSHLGYAAFTLGDAQSRTYSELSDATYSLWRAEHGYGNRLKAYLPGESRDDVAVFRVSPDASGFRLLWRDRTFDTGG